jgi:antitoxin Phd
MDWQLAEAKNRLSEVVNRALTEGPQRIKRRGDRVVVLSKAEYDRLTGKQRSLVEFVLDGPDLGDLEISPAMNRPCETSSCEVLA